MSIEEQKERENNEHALYSEWFMDNLEDNVEEFIDDTIAEFSEPKKQVEEKRLLDLYYNTYEKDDKFEKYCEEKAERLQAEAEK